MPVLQIGPKGTLQEMQIDERQVSYYTMQMIKALRYCHSESILHRDLKP